MGAMRKQTEPRIVIEWNGRDGATTLESVDKEQLRELACILGRIAARRDLAQARKDRALFELRATMTDVQDTGDAKLSVAKVSPAE
jgi:hypothetical protein